VALHAAALASDSSIGCADAAIIAALITALSTNYQTVTLQPTPDKIVTQ
jgi:hypothetical protein